MTTLSISLALSINDGAGEAEITVKIDGHVCTYRTARNGLGRYAMSVNGIEGPEGYDVAYLDSRVNDRIGLAAAINEMAARASSDIRTVLEDEARAILIPPRQTPSFIMVLQHRPLDGRRPSQSR